jgi:hypothetical protein
MPDLSADRHAILERLKQADDAAERLLRGKSREQANWQPKQGTSWSMWQCFDHLARINRVYCQALLAAVENPRETREQMIMPGWFSRWFTRSMGLPVRTRFKAPAGDSNASWRSRGSLTRFLGISCARAARPGVLGSSQLQSGALQEPVRAAASFYHRHRTAGHQCA